MQLKDESHFESLSHRIWWTVKNPVVYLTCRLTISTGFALRSMRWGPARTHPVTNVCQCVCLVSKRHFCCNAVPLACKTKYLVCTYDFSLIHSFPGPGQHLWVLFSSERRLQKEQKTLATAGRLQKGRRKDKNERTKWRKWRSKLKQNSLGWPFIEWTSKRGNKTQSCIWYSDYYYILYIFIIF